MASASEMASVITMKREAPELTSAEIGKSLGLTKDVVQKIIRRSGLSAVTRVSTPVKAVVLPKPMKLTGDWLVVGDIHSYTMDAKYLDRAVDMALAMDVGGAIIAGDLFCMDRYSKYPSLIPAEATTLEIAAARKAMAKLSRLPEIVWVSGNHDRRLSEKTSGDITMEHLATLVSSGITSNLRTTLYNYAHLKSGREPWIISHAFKYSRGIGSVARKIATAHHAHVLHHHQHLTGITRTENNRWWAIDNGCIALQSKTAYAALNLSDMPVFQKGFTIIKDGLPTVAIGDTIFSCGKI